MHRISRMLRNNRTLRRNRNDHLLHLSSEKSRPNRVNLNYWKSGVFREVGLENLGDALSPVHAPTSPIDQSTVLVG